MLCLGDVIFKLDELIAEKSINGLFTRTTRKKDPKGEAELHGRCWQQWNISQKPKQVAQHGESEAENKTEEDKSQDNQLSP